MQTKQFGRAFLASLQRGFASKVIDGQTLYFEEIGKGPTSVLLLPGALGSSRTDFATILPKFNRDKLTVIAWDPPGYGRSRPPDRTWPPRFFERDAAMGVALMRALQRPRFSALGWSDGGNTGMLMAILFPEAVERLAMWGCNSFICEEDLQLYDNVRTPEQWSARMREPFEADLGADYFRRILEEWCRAMEAYPDGDVCRHRLHEIRCPTLLIHGGLDALVPPFHPDHIEANVEKIRRVDFPGGKHNLHLKYADEFMREVHAFLES